MMVCRIEALFVKAELGAILCLVFAFLEVDQQTERCSKDYRYNSHDQNCVFGVLEMYVLKSIVFLVTILCHKF
jgi:hypothetical protein